MSPLTSEGSQVFTLQFEKGHLFLELDGKLWLFDTGAPTSFGDVPSINICNKPFAVSANYLGLTADAISQLAGVTCAGLLGMDVLGYFDHIVDIEGGRLTVSPNELNHDGEVIPLDEFMGIPIINVHIKGKPYRMFFDTGAQVSYFNDDSLTAFPAAGRVTDFYPGIGQFETDIYNVPVSLGGGAFTLRYGSLPNMFSMILAMASVNGIVGNEVIINRVIGYFPRRKMLVL